MNEEPDRHSRTLKDHFYQLYNNQSFCDLSLHTKNGTTLLAHKLIVAAFSGTVKAGVEKDVGPCVSITVDCKDTVLRKVLEYIYTGKIDCKKELLPLLEQASIVLQIPTLKSYLHEEFNHTKRTEKNRSSTSPNISLGLSEPPLSNGTGDQPSNNHNAMQKPAASLSNRKTGKHALSQIVLPKSEESLSNGAVGKQSVMYAVHTPEACIFSVENTSSAMTSSDSSQNGRDNNKSSMQLRQTRNRKSDQNNELFDFNWSDNELCTVSDNEDEYQDETWNCGMQTQSESKKNTRKKDNGQKTNFKQVVVKLERIENTVMEKLQSQFSQTQDQNRPSTKKLQDKTNTKRKVSYSKRNKKPVDKNVSTTSMTCSQGSKSKQKYTRKILTELSQNRKKKNHYEKRKLNHILSKQCIVKVRQSVKRCQQKKPMVLKGKQILKHYKKGCDVVFTRYGYACKFCNFRHKYSSVVKLHAKKHRTESVIKSKEKSTTNKFQKALRLKKLDTIKKKISRLECFLCGNIYKEMRNLATHLIKNHKYTAGKTQQLTGYPRYFVVNTIQKPVCEECNEEFTYILDYRIHCRTVHRKAKIDPDIPCLQDGCTEKFLNLKSLKAHLAKYHQIKNANNLTFRQQDPKPEISVSEETSSTPRKKPRSVNIMELFEREKNKSFDQNKKVERKEDTNKSRSSFRPSHNYKIIVPSKVFKCNRCAKSFKSHHKMIHKSHRDFSHNKILVSQQFKGRLIVKKHLRPAYPTTKNYTRTAVYSDQNKIKYQYMCSKCNFSFSLYSKFCLHFANKHRKGQKSHRETLANVARHVENRKDLFTHVSKFLIIKNPPKNGRKYVCDICYRTYVHAKSLTRHLREAHYYKQKEARQKALTSFLTSELSGRIRKRIKCIKCETTFVEVRNHATHLQNCHDYTFEQARKATGYPSYRKGKKKVIFSNPQTCNICQKRLPTMSSYRQHRVEVHGVTCKYCNKRFGNKSFLKKHGLQEHPDHKEDFQNLKVKRQHKLCNEDTRSKPKAHNCEKCDFSTRKLNELTAHVLDNHPEVEHPCYVCGFTFRQKISLENHIAKHHGDAAKKKLPCAWCPKKFLKNCILRIHQFKVHGISHPSVKQYSCDVDGCKKVFQRTSALKVHKKLSHAARTTFPCKECDYQAKSKHAVQKHIRAIHLQMKSNMCEGCGKFFTEHQHMKEHIRKFHTHDYYELQCEHCTLRFGAKNLLQTHMWHAHKIRMEDDKRSYFHCDQCAYQTPLANKFRDHMNSHSDTRNHACDQCDKRFVTSSTLRSHKQWKHALADEDKVCNQCGYKTKTIAKLNEHIRVQHQLKGIKPYRCTYCDFRCATSGNCRKHIMGKHKGEPVKYQVDKEYLDVAKLARKEGYTNPLIVQVQNYTNEDLTTADQDLLAASLETLPQYDPGIFNQIIQDSIL